MQCHLNINFNHFVPDNTPSVGGHGILFGSLLGVAVLAIALASVMGVAMIRRRRTVYETSSNVQVLSMENIAASKEQTGLLGVFIFQFSAIDIANSDDSQYSDNSSSSEIAAVENLGFETLFITFLNV